MRAAMLLVLVALGASGCNEICEPTVGVCSDGSCKTTWFCGSDSDSYSAEVAADGTCSCIQNGEVTTVECGPISCALMNITLNNTLSRGEPEFDELDDAANDVCGFGVTSASTAIVTGCQ